MELSELDKTRIKLDIKIFVMLSLFFFGLVILFLGLISGAVLFFEPKEGFYSRILNIFSVFALLIIALNFNSILKFVDLKIGKKIRIQTNSYEIREQKKLAFIVIHEPKLKIEIEFVILPNKHNYI